MSVFIVAVIFAHYSASPLPKANASKSAGVVVVLCLKKYVGGSGVLNSVVRNPK